MNQLDNWQTLRFDQFGHILSGSTPSTTNASYWNGSIVWITPNDLSKLKTPYLYNSAKRISAQGLNACSAALLPARSIVMSSRAPIGYVAIPLVDFCTNQGCKSIVLKEGFDPGFAYYNINFNIDKVKNLGEGTTFAEISKTALCNVEIAFPQSEAEQAKIAEVLSTVDRAIAQTQSLIAKQQRIKTGLMQDLLTRGIDEQGNLRTEATHPFKDSPLGRIPVEWDVVSLGSLTESPESITYGVLKPGPYIENGVPLLQIEDVIHGHVQIDQLHRISPDLSAQYRRTQLSGGEIVVSLVGTVGRIALLPPSVCGANLHRNLALVRISSPNSSKFIFHYLRSRIGQQEILDGTLGSTQALLNLSSLRSLKTLNPTVIEQNAIAKKMDAVDSLISNTVVLNKKLVSLKNALMQDLLTGKKRVTPLLNS